LDNKEKYLKKMDEIKAKTFFGKHPIKYTGDWMPVTTFNSSPFAPLKETGFMSRRGMSQN